MRKVMGACLIGMLGLAPARAAYVYAPGAQYETQEASASNEQGIVFTRGGSTHMQLGFDSTLFGAAPVLVSEIAFRFDKITNQTQVPTVFYDFGRTIIQAATYRDINTMSGTFAANLGRGTKTVLDRAYTLTSTNTGPVDGPRSWGFVFSFDQAFYYDPTKGDLIIDLATFNGPQASATLDQLRSGSLLRWVYGYGGDATTGVAGMSFDGGPVSRLTVSTPPAVPEPASWAMMLAGFGLVGGAIRRRAPSALPSA